MKNGLELYKAIGERKTNAQIRNDMQDFLQYILDQWELDTREVQERAEQLLNNMKGINMKPYIERGHDGEDDYEYFELEKKINEE